MHQVYPWFHLNDSNTFFAWTEGKRGGISFFYHGRDDVGFYFSLLFAKKVDFRPKKAPPQTNRHGLLSFVQRSVNGFRFLSFLFLVTRFRLGSSPLLMIEVDDGFLFFGGVCFFGGILLGEDLFFSARLEFFPLYEMGELV